MLFSPNVIDVESAAAAEEDIDGVYLVEVCGIAGQGQQVEIDRGGRRWINPAQEPII